MGTCCSPVKLTKEAAEMLFVDSTRSLIEKINHVYRKNPFHHYGTKRQEEFIESYVKYQAGYIPSNTLSQTTPQKFKKAMEEFDYVKLMIMFIFDKCKEMLSIKGKWGYKFNMLMMKKELNVFSRPDIIYIYILLFTMCNTKNTVFLKERFIEDIINQNFFSGEEQATIDVDKLKIMIKSLIRITLDLFECMVLLFCFLSNSQLKNIFASNDVNQRELIHKMVFDWIKKETNRDFSYDELESRWLNYIIEPIIFAGYSSQRNERNYNLILQNEICKRIMKLCDREYIIHSFIYLQIADSQW